MPSRASKTIGSVVPRAFANVIETDRASETGARPRSTRKYSTPRSVKTSTVTRSPPSSAGVGDLEVALPRAAMAQPGSGRAVPVGQPVHHVSWVLSDQRRFPRDEVHAPQVEHRPVTAIGHDDDVPGVGSRDPVNPRSGAFPGCQINRPLPGSIDGSEVDVIALIAVAILEIEDAPAIGRPL